MHHDHSAPAEKASPCVVVPSPDLGMSRSVAIIEVAVVGGTSLAYVALEATVLAALAYPLVLGDAPLSRV